MKRSSKVLLYGFLGSLVLMVLCIHFHIDKFLAEDRKVFDTITMQGSDETFKPKAIIPSTPIKTFDPEKREQFNPSSLTYRIHDRDLMIDGKLPLLENGDRFKEALMAHCKSYRCERNVVYMKDQAYPVWNKFAQMMIAFFHEQNLTNAELKIDTTNRVTLTGELPSDEEQIKLQELIQNYGVSYDVYNQTRVRIVEASTGVAPERQNSSSEIIEESLDPIDEAQHKVSEILANETINFQHNKAAILKSSQKTLDKIIGVVKDIPNIRLEVNGYTDASGKKRINKWISQERAKSVKNYLGSKGLNPRDIKARGYGESNFLDKENTYNPINRRVEIVIKRR